MWNLILSFFTGPLASISKDLKEAYQTKINAANDKERIAADERIALLEARKSTILAAQSDPFERFIRILFALPFVIYINKLILWDKVLEWGLTDPLSPDLNKLLWIVIGGYFINYTVEQVGKMKK